MASSILLSVPGVPGSAQSFVRHHGTKELDHRLYNFRECLWRMGLAKAFTESLPLCLFAIHKSGRKRIGFRDFRSPLPESPLNRPLEILQRDFMLAREPVSYTHLTLPTNREV